MTRLTDEAIKELQNVYHKEYGKEISDGEARQLGERLITFFKITYRPIPEEDVVDKGGKYP